MDRVRVAARAAVGIALFLVLRALVSAVVTTVSFVTPHFPDTGNEYVAGPLTDVWLAALFGFFNSGLPFSAGVFLSFVILPIRGDLRVGQVLLRGAVAALVGAFAVAVLVIVVNLGTWVAPPPTGVGVYAVTPLGPHPVDVIVGAVGSGVATAPLGMLAALLSWGWPRWRSATPRPSAADPVVHWEIIGRDPAGLRVFYERVFDWEADTDAAVAPSISDAGEYGFVPVPAGADGIPGGVGGGPGFTPHTVFYIDVDDVGDALGRVRAAGGTTVLEPSTRPDGALVVAHFTDPEGNLVGLAGPR